MAGSAFKDKKIVDLVKKSFTPILIDGDVNKKLGPAYGVSGFPMTVFTDRKGEKLTVAKGAVPKSKFQSLLEAAAKKAGPPKPSKDYATLEKQAIELRKSMVKGRTKNALRAIKKIEDVEVDCFFTDEAREAKEKIIAESDELLEKAKALMEADAAGAKKILTKLKSNYIGLDACNEAKDLLKKLAEK